MNTFDFSPLYRTAIGFDRMVDLLSNASRTDTNGYPPYNIESLGEDRYRITMAVAGFDEDEIDIVSEQNMLAVTGQRKEEDQAENERQLLYRGIATRPFERRFQLADYVRVDGARLENGLLHIELLRELPEQMKPRKIEISGSSRLIEGEKQKSKAA